MAKVDEMGKPHEQSSDDENTSVSSEEGSQESLEEADGSASGGESDHKLFTPNEGKMITDEQEVNQAAETTEVKNGSEQSGKKDGVNCEDGSSSSDGNDLSSNDGNNGDDSSSDSSSDSNSTSSSDSSNSSINLSSSDDEAEGKGEKEKTKEKAKEETKEETKADGDIPKSSLKRWTKTTARNQHPALTETALESVYDKALAALRKKRQVTIDDLHTVVKKEYPGVPHEAPSIYAVMYAKLLAKKQLSIDESFKRLAKDADKVVPAKPFPCTTPTRRLRKKCSGHILYLIWC